MSRTRWVTSALLIWHLTAMAIASVPPPDRLQAVGPPRHPVDDPIAAQLTPLFDEAAAGMLRICEIVWQAIRPIQRPAALYMSAIGLEDRWNMFANPPRIDEYVRIRYYVGTSASREGHAPTWAATELVFPTHRADQVRMIRSYWQKHRDKSISSAISAFRERRDGHLTKKADTRPEELPDDLAPVLRYFQRRFESRHLLEHESVVRAEVWRGRVANPPRAAGEDPGILERRLAVLRRYYDGPIEQRVPRGAGTPPYFAAEWEGDIEWLLEYFEE